MLESILVLIVYASKIWCIWFFTYSIDLSLL